MLGIHLEINSKRRKEKVIKQLLSSKQSNEGVVNIHRISPNNVGDFYCGPHLYFEKLAGKKLDISGLRSIKKQTTNHWIKTISNNSLIIGGGGLLNIRHFRMQMEIFEKLATQGKKVVLWGAGHNEIDLKSYSGKKTYDTDVSKFGLVGTRDVSFPGEWVPCVSCLHPIFDKSFEIKHKTGLLFNAKSVKNNDLLKKFEYYPMSSNTTNLEEMISYIGSCETLVTNSYHAMYWAILMEKKVISIPATSKFLDFKYKTPIATFENFETKLNDATKYTGVLQECREINHNFAEKVFDYLQL